MTVECKQNLIFLLLPTVSREIEDEGILLGYYQTVVSAWKSVRVKTIQVECIGSVCGNLLSHASLCSEPNNHVTNQAASAKQKMYSARFASGKLSAWPLIHSRDSIASS